MSETLPIFRMDVDVTVQHEDGEDYIVLHDQMGFADGPIMVHADMISILEACDGVTTWEEVATRSKVELDGPEILRVRTFLGQLDAMGFLETSAAEELREKATSEWDALASRPAVCAGATYPSDPDELRTFLDEMLEEGKSETDERTKPPVGFLIPHIDFRVAPKVYGPAFNAMRNTDSDLFVLIGTSHYWSNDRVILTDKDFDTPLGAVATDRALVQDLRSRLSVLDFEDGQTVVSSTDLAHRPEHSLELHAIFLKHLFGDRPITILPVLVTGLGGEFDVYGEEAMAAAGKAIASVVEDSGRKAMWIISGDLAHVGKRFGDEIPAREMLGDVAKADKILLEHLKGADADGYHAAIEATGLEYRICGHAPTYLAFRAFQPEKGETLAHEVWDDA